MSMSETLISFETAKLAKEKGFKEYYNRIYVLDEQKENDRIGKVHYRTETYFSNSNHLNKEFVTAPTQSLLQKWLREKHNIIVNSIPYEDEIPECEGGERQTLWEDETIDCREIPWLRDITTHTYYHSYEEALENALVEGLKLINK